MDVSNFQRFVFNETLSYYIVNHLLFFFSEGGKGKSKVEAD